MVETSNKNSQYLTIFKGMNYNFLSLNMTTLFRYQELRDLVECGFINPHEGHVERLKENRKKVSKENFLIQQDLHDSIFSRISAA